LPAATSVRKGVRKGKAAYADWLAALPDSLQRSATADALEAMVDLDLTPLADVEPPRGYGRD
jgi:hypothetical protein